MNTNKTVLEVLAQEGVLVTEQELTRATRNKQQLSGVVPVEVKSPAESNGAVASPMPTRHLVPSDGSREGPQSGRTVKALRAVWLFLFEALREAYWLLDRDAKCRSQGVQTVGQVVSTQTREHTDS